MNSIGSRIDDELGSYESARLVDSSLHRIDKYDKKTSPYKIPIQARLAPRTKDSVVNRRDHGTHGMSSIFSARSQSLANLNAISIQSNMQQVRNMYAGQKKQMYNPLDSGLASQLGRSLSNNKAHNLMVTSNSILPTIKIVS